MIVCLLDGKKGYPSTTDKIKVTFENQFVKSSGSYTYDISFPMAISANRKIFGNVQRMDVSKQLPTFEECMVYTDNRIVISGKGTVTSVTNDTVKVQIVGGKSRVKYNSNFEKHFIDEIDYPAVVLDTGINKSVYEDSGVELPNMDKSHWIVFTDLTTANFVGQKGVAVLSPTYDETNDIMANKPCLTKYTEVKVEGLTLVNNSEPYMANCALCPYLIYILRKVMEYEGYTISQNDIDKAPWDRLVIVSACKSGKIKDALPHWTVYKFIDELRKFFNVSFIFDEKIKTVKIINTDEMFSNEALSYECEDEFSAEHDDDGLDSLATSNIEYSFDDSTNRDWREYISQSVFKNYETKTYSTIDNMVSAAEKMTQKERKTTIFKVGYNYYIWADLPKDGNPDTEETTEQRTLCGLFNPIIRDIGSDTFQELNICPAAIYKTKISIKNAGPWKLLGDNMMESYIEVPSVSNDKEQSFEDAEVDDDGDIYYSVQDAMQGSSEETSSADTDDDSKMRVAFQAENVVNVKKKAAVAYNQTLPDEDKRYRVPVLYTDYRMYPQNLIYDEEGSLSLEALPMRRFVGIEGSAASGRFGEKQIERHNQITIKFFTDDIPDPTKIFVFHNKRYICEKIEMDISNDGIDKLKTGYFYEFL